MSGKDGISTDGVLWISCSTDGCSQYRWAPPLVAILDETGKGESLTSPPTYARRFKHTNLCGALDGYDVATWMLIKQYFFEYGNFYCNTDQWFGNEQY